MPSRRKRSLFSEKPGSSRIDLEQDHEGSFHVTVPKDSIAGCLLLALAAGYWWLTRSIPESSLSDEVGADGLPKLLAAALAVVACLLVGKGLISLKSATPVVVNDDDTQEQAPLPRALGFTAIGVGYMFLAPLVGFPFGIAALVVAVALYEREALSIKLVAVATGGGLGFWLVFVRFLGTEQPVSSLLAMFMKV
jgi:putative tricarboxylic transport membrane protein